MPPDLFAGTVECPPEQPVGYLHLSGAVTLPYSWQQARRAPNLPSGTVAGWKSMDAGCVHAVGTGGDCCVCQTYAVVTLIYCITFSEVYPVGFPRADPVHARCAVGPY